MNYGKSVVVDVGLTGVLHGVGDTRKLIGLYRYITCKSFQTFKMYFGRLMIGYFLSHFGPIWYKDFEHFVESC